MYAKVIDIKNKKFNYLTAVEFIGLDKGRSAVWKFICDCGKEVITTSISVRTNTRVSCGCKRRLPNNQAAINRVYSSYTRRAKVRNLDFNLTLEQFVEITSQPCTYCKIEPKQLMKLRSSSWYIYTGIDRIDSNKGYIINNCVPCCGPCNSVKTNLLTQEDMVYLMEYKTKSYTIDPWLDQRNNHTEKLKQYAKLANKKDKQ